MFAMEAFSWVVALRIFGSGSVGDQPLKKRDDPPSLGPGEASPQARRRRGRQARQALLLPHDRATGSSHYSSRPETPGALSLFISFIEHVGGALEGLPGRPMAECGLTSHGPRWLAAATVRKPTVAVSVLCSFRQLRASSF